MAPDDDKPAPPKPDPTVKQLLERDLGKPLEEIVDAATAAELHRWFGLPSFEQAAETAAAPPENREDPGITAVRERIAKALESVDPGMLQGLHDRAERAWGLIRFQTIIDSKVDLAMTFFDEAMLARLHVVAEPRELQQPEDIVDDLRDQTPQALLRDLHRAELNFDKQFEIVDAAANQSLDIVAEVKAAMGTNWKLPTLMDPPSVVLRKVFAEIHEERTEDWSTLPKRAHMPNRRVTE